MIRSVTSTRRFIGSRAGPVQLLEVAVDAPPGTSVEVRGAGHVIGTARTTGAATIEVPLVDLSEPVGARVPVEVSALGAVARGEVVVSEPGWTVWMIPHFHYDPVWWNTQAAYTTTWDELGPAAQATRAADQQPGFALVRAHLAAARRDPDYRFVLAEVDYLKPYWDAYPGDRAILRRLIAEGRLEIVGGTYNEPNTNLTSAETTARNFVYGIGFQRAVMGGDPQTAWQLDVFGHDPQFPGLAAAAGLSSSSWARGPFHQWGPLLHASGRAQWGDPSVMQFPTEFEWLSPSGSGVLTHYMAAHYSAGWRIDSTTTLTEAQREMAALFEVLAEVAATRNVLIPVGTDYTPPSKWVTQIQRDWNSRYAWPRVVCGLPRDFFAAVRAEMTAAGRRPVPITRDMNPIYTGKDVSFIDTKQAQRRAETLLVEAEMFATFASWLGARYPAEALDRAWRQLVYGAHHDAITGSEGDQVYLDLLTGWREAHDLAEGALRASLDVLAAGLRGDERPSITVFNPSVWNRVDLVEVAVTVPRWHGIELLGPDGEPVPVLVEDVRSDEEGRIDQARLTFVAELPGLGYDARWRLREGAGALGWMEEDGFEIANDSYRIRVDPARGGCVIELVEVATGRSLLLTGELGNELVLEAEHREHPTFHEGPWHLLPTGETLARSSEHPATSVAVRRCPIGARLVITGELAGIGYEQQLTLWHGLRRLNCATRLDGFAGADQLLRLRWPADIPGASPVSDTGAAVIGRGFALLGRDAAKHPWTLDNPANHWFALSSTTRVRIHDASGGAWHDRAIGIAELVAADGDDGSSLRELAVALAGGGVTSTSSRGDGARYGILTVDSNLPDVRISVGAPEANSFTAAVLDTADPRYRADLHEQLAVRGWAAVWVPAARALREVWQPDADLSGHRDLPVLLLIGDEAVAAVVTDLADAIVEITQTGPAAPHGEPALDDHTIALINTGTPGFAVTSDGALHQSLLRSCTGWPSGVWIDPPERRMPDGSTFQQQHWTHEWHHALVSGPGDWRSVGAVRAGFDANHPLRASVAQQAGEVAASGRLLDVRTDDEIVLAAVKPRGNPLAEGRAVTSTNELTVRLYEAAGRPAEVELNRGELAALTDHVLLDLVECGTHSSAGASYRLRPMEVMTLGATVDVTAAEHTPLVPPAEDRQPVYSRYWLNNTGPVPLGGLPLSVHLDPHLIRTEREPINLRITVASDRTDSATDATVTVIVPDGWTATPSELAYRLDPGGHAIDAIEVLPTADAPDGVYWVRARAELADDTVEDVTRILLGPDQRPELTVRRHPPTLTLQQDGCGVIEIVLHNSAYTTVSARVQMVSPWHVWQLLAQWDAGADIPARGAATVRFPVRVPRGLPPGTWWAVPKIASAGFVHFAEPVTIRVMP